MIDGLVFDMDTFAVHDGPGIRMAVYLKGCPLACRWCHSPESQRAQAGTDLRGRPVPAVRGVRDSRAGKACTRCGEGRHELTRAQCQACGQCVERCPAGALQIKGYRVTAEAIVERAVRLKPFFDGSGGGVTLTGGEVTMQAEFAAAVLAGCRGAGIHTAIETCGSCEWPVLESLLRLRGPGALRPEDHR